ncbi:type I-B CRISPR-associated endonuclease Cas1 [Terrilactibacillus sp. BCM23-1]|uniref:CRISPR-associated endonuclease Cas1 n=1 Tax=Terrilactibacillus tamarindi TaxID=2599694 RepID=A0A6N8CQK9_9BACI|nr:type I-B CRISPR-associated endonuclease Cas1b [Terrilactibacillus tamarindi]MTT31373.1 type I-B CRISPR-associated endonuclease Cas1 [Terrilactibacillus tamarindi]
MAQSTKYLVTMGELKRKDNSLIFRNEKGHRYVPIEGIKEIYCLNEVSFNTKLLDFLSKAQVTVHFFNYFQQYSGTFYPKENLVSGCLLIKQVQLFNESRLDVAKAIVQGIANNVYYILYHYYSHGKTDLKPFLHWLRKSVPQLLQKEINIKQILFIEGTIWKKFYDSFSLFLPKAFLMNKRVKRPPDNPMNAMISFGNSLLYAKTVSQIYHTHLDQKISFLHEPGEGRFSLSLDLCEVFKPIIVYKTIFELVNNRRIQVGKHFDKELNYCLLSEKGKMIFLKAFDERINQTFQHPILKRKVSYQTAIKLDAYKLIKMCIEGKKFVPYDFKEKC